MADTGTNGRLIVVELSAVEELVDTSVEGRPYNFASGGGVLGS